MAESAYTPIGGEVEMDLARPMRSGTWDFLAHQEVEVVASTKQSHTM